MAKAKSQNQPDGDNSHLGFEAQLRAAADKMRGHSIKARAKLPEISKVTASLEEQFAESAKLEKAIRQNLKALSHG
jgi:hypothetical protein